MVGKGFGGRGLDLAEEGRGGELLDVGVEQVRRKLSCQSLGVLAILDQWSSLAQGQQDLVFSNCLKVLSASKASPRQGDNGTKG